MEDREKSLEGTRCNCVRGGNEIWDQDDLGKSRPDKKWGRLSLTIIAKGPPQTVYWKAGDGERLIVDEALVGHVSRALIPSTLKLNPLPLTPLRSRFA